MKLVASLVLVGDGDGDGSLPWTVVRTWGGTRCGRRSELEGLVGRQYAIPHEYRTTSSRPAFRSICSAQLSSLMRKESAGCDRLRLLPRRYCWISRLGEA